MLIKELLKFHNKIGPKNLYGIEVEIEGSRLPASLSERTWSVTTDGSLQDGLEYVLSTPLPFEAVPDALEVLHEGLVANEATIHDTVRAGVHIHVNVRDMTLTNLLNFITISIMFEGVLARYCGSSREGNLFCLRSTDAEYILKAISDVAHTGDLSLFNDDDLRYAFINLKAIPVHGSVEFRALKTPVDLARIFEWVEIIEKLRQASFRYDSPAQIISGYSGGSEMDFFNDTAHLMHRGVRQAQDIALSDVEGWDKLTNIIQHNPFHHVKQQRNSRIGISTPKKSVQYLKKDYIEKKYGRKTRRNKRKPSPAYALSMADFTEGLRERADPSIARINEIGDDELRDILERERDRSG